MKGVIFTEFIDMVEEKFGYEMVDQIITSSNDPEDGAYTAVSTYDHTQLVNLVVALHQKSKIPLRDLLLTYGQYLFGRLVITNPALIKGIEDSFELLLNIELMIHTEVRKLYPEANPPKFSGKRIDKNTLELIYQSHRSMGDVAEGLMYGCADHFGEKFQIEQTAVEEGGQKVHFKIIRVQGE